MSEVMRGVLLMPPRMWCDSPLDVQQRHSIYVGAARKIDELEAEVEKANADLVAYRAEANALEEVVRRLNDEYRAEIEMLRELMIRYRTETPLPLGHQPHMIAHEVDEALKETK